MIEAKAFVLRKSGEIPELEDIYVSDRLSEGQVLVRVLYSGLCATQLEEIFVSSRNSSYLPHLLGHEGVGVIEQVGPGVRVRKPGETCVIHWRKSSIGVDALSGTYVSGDHKLSSGKVATLSSVVVVPENRLTPVPDDFPLEKAALLGCLLTTAWGSLAKVGGFQADEPVLIIGLGAVGTFSAWSARQLGSQNVTAIDPRGVIASSWMQRGADEYFRDATEFDRVYTSGGQRDLPNLILDTSGDPRMIEGLIERAPLTARIVLVGMPKQSQRVRLDSQRLLDGLALLGSNGGSVDPALEIVEVSRLFSPLINKDLGWGVQIMDLDRNLEKPVLETLSGEKLRVIIDWGKSPISMRS
jgi:S-(hydroxymethyl)glutathione dehydrogenase/alcohol dehydrogenase